MKETVPFLNLAPKLNRPLQLWNPLDYLLLLYWVFFFPQALRWYVETFVTLEHRNAKGKDLWKAFRQDIVLRYLVLQAFLLVVFIAIAVIWIMALAGHPIEWSGVAFGLASGVAFGLAFGLASGVASGLASGVASGVVLGVAFGLDSGVASGLASGVVLGVASGLAFGVALGVAFGLDSGVASGLASGLAFGVVLGVASGLAFGVASGLAFSVTTVATILRLDAWAIGSLYFAIYANTGSSTRSTPLPLSGLSRYLNECLRDDWPTGVHNLNELLAYSMQFIPVVRALNDAFEELPSPRLLAMADEIAKDPYDWNLLYFASASLENRMKASAIRGIAFLPGRWKDALKARYPADLRLDTQARAACAGFWYLHKRQPLQASQAFAVVRTLPNGEEMYLITQALLHAQGAKDFSSLADLSKKTDLRQMFTQPSDPELMLHPTTWQALEHLQRCTLEALAVQESASKAARSWALNRAISEVVVVLEMIETIPKAERALVKVIAENWQKFLLSVAGDIGKFPIQEPVRTPYVVGDPVIGAGFKGREDILRRLEELWCGSTASPSVVLCGHRRMGKTSILRNINSHLGSEVRLAYVNLLILGGASGGISDLLLAIADEVQASLPGLPKPDEGAFDRHPYRAFEQFLVQALACLGPSRLIIALDEFEQLEEWMRAGQIPRDVLKVLRGYMQKDEHIAFVFAGLHSLEEMTANYFEPFFASALTIPVSFLSHDATFQVLANPTQEDFPLDYSRDALERIWELTGGQPYLVQLVGHHLVSRFNRLTFEQGRPLVIEFKLDDVETVIGDPDFYSQGRYYFAGVWGQAGQGAEGQQEILKFVAAFPDGISSQGITARFGPNSDKIAAALNELQRHDVLAEKEGQWRYTVELMRRWVKDFFGSNN